MYNRKRCYKNTILRSTITGKSIPTPPSTKTEEGIGRTETKTQVRPVANGKAQRSNVGLEGRPRIQRRLKKPAQGKHLSYQTWRTNLRGAEQPSPWR